jgi:hypothetical protein
MIRAALAGLIEKSLGARNRADEPATDPRHHLAH